MIDDSHKSFPGGSQLKVTRVIHWAFRPRKFSSVDFVTRVKDVIILTTLNRAHQEKLLGLGLFVYFFSLLV